MKNLLLFTFIGISSISFSQGGYLNNSTWLYNFSKNETYINEWNIPYSYGIGQIKYSIYYAKQGNWQYVGSITISEFMYFEKVYFKSNFRVAYGKENEKPTEIIFETKQWKVE